jgi:hypothetical protein
MHINPKLNRLGFGPGSLSTALRWILLFA